MTALDRYRAMVHAYKPMSIDARAIGGADFDDWLRHYIIMMSVYGYERGLRGDNLRRYVNAERKYAVQTHNHKIEPERDSILRQALRHEDTAIEWMDTVIRDIEENR